MKIGITGHTDGIGKAIAEACEAAGHEVVGFSRTTGYHLFTDIEGVVADAEDCDVFINNRFNYTREQSGQVELLYRMFEKWLGKDKRIINISSRAGTYTSVGKIDRYSVFKHALDTACDQLNLLRDMRPRVTNIKPGYVDTESIKHITDNPKLKPEAIAETVMWIINQPSMVHISSISMAHMRFG
jgi:NADP-dependent 3-hydroxy acid dehydrogenase YdfG